HLLIKGLRLGIGPLTCRKSSPTLQPMFCSNSSHPIQPGDERTLPGRSRNSMPTDWVAQREVVAAFDL
ncbi:MAG: hypothetical protein ABIR55_22310, partial [Burkholderiaceae bacterium]